MIASRHSHERRLIAKKEDCELRELEVIAGDSSVSQYAASLRSASTILFASGMFACSSTLENGQCVSG